MWEYCTAFVALATECLLPVQATGHQCSQRWEQSSVSRVSNSSGKNIIWGKRQMYFGIRGRTGAQKEQQRTGNICWLAGKQCQVQAEETLTVLPKFIPGEVSDRPHFPNADYTACFWPSRWVWGAQLCLSMRMGEADLPSQSYVALHCICEAKWERLKEGWRCHPRYEWYHLMPQCLSCLRESLIHPSEFFPDAETQF